jgi:hypothetical protein
VIQHSNDFEAVIRAARRVSTPLIAARTFDPASAAQRVLATLNNKTESTPAIRWDVMRGLGHFNEAGRRALAQILDGRNPEMLGPTDVLLLAQRFPEDTILVLANSHRFWNDPAVMQGIWNLRDVFKTSGCTLMLLASPGARLPEELVQDVLVLDQPLPTVAELEDIVRDMFEAAEMQMPSDGDLVRAVDAMIGLSTFPAEQVLAMCLTKKGLAFDQLWERKRQVIAQTPGLSVWRSGETFDDIGGCENAKIDTTNYARC